MAIVQWKRASSPETRSEATSLDLWDRFQDDWDRFFGWGPYPETSGLFDRSTYPLIDVVENEDGCVLWADIPGLDRDDLDLSVTANVLTIKGEKKVPSGDGKTSDRVFRDETWVGRFQRSLSLPDSVDPEKIQAEFRDGVLKVTIGKRPEHKPRQIAVSVK